MLTGEVTARGPVVPMSWLDLGTPVACTCAAVLRSPAVQVLSLVQSHLLVRPEERMWQRQDAARYPYILRGTPVRSPDLYGGCKTEYPRASEMDGGVTSTTCRATS